MKNKTFNPISKTHKSNMAPKTMINRKILMKNHKYKTINNTKKNHHKK